MSRRLDADFLIAMALRRVRRGGVARVEDQWFYRGKPMPPGLLTDVYPMLLDNGLIETSQPDAYGTARVTLTLTGQSRYAELVLAQQADPTVLPPITVEPDPPPGRVVDLPASEKARRILADPDKFFRQARAERSAELAPPGDRPDPINEEEGPR